MSPEDWEKLKKGDAVVTRRGQPLTFVRPDGSRAFAVFQNAAGAQIPLPYGSVEKEKRNG